PPRRLPPFPTRRSSDLTYVVTRTAIPSLSTASVNVRLNDAGKDFMPRVNQLDLSLSKRVRVGQVNIAPQLELFNALNVSPETSIDRKSTRLNSSHVSIS